MILRGKTALITGASRRIGRSIAFELARAGTDIIVHYHESSKEAHSLVRELSSMGVKAWPVSANFSPRKSLTPVLKKLFIQIYRCSPHIDILVNNASIYEPTPLRTSEADWDRFLTINLKIPFLLAQEIGARMFKKKWGSIINLADSAVSRPHKDYIPYAASKAGLMTVTQGLAKAYAPYVRVNAILPGPILPAAGHSAAHHRKAASRTLLNRYGTPEDIAKTVRFLCEGSDFMTGALIPVDGGAAIF